MVTKILVVVSTYSSTEIVDDKKEEVVAEAALTLTWIVIRCGGITFDEQTNKYVLDASHRDKVHDMMRKEFAKPTRFCEHFLKHLKSIHLKSLSRKLLSSFIRLLTDVAPMEYRYYLYYKKFCSSDVEHSRTRARHSLPQQN